MTIRRENHSGLVAVACWGRGAAAGDTAYRIRLRRGAFTARCTATSELEQAVCTDNAGPCRVEIFRGAGGEYSLYHCPHQDCRPFTCATSVTLMRFATGVGTHPGRGESAGLMGTAPGHNRHVPAHARPPAKNRRCWSIRLRFLSRIAKQGGVEAVGIV